MGEQLNCLIKRKQGTCLWHTLLEIDQKILQKKRYYTWIESQMKQYEFYLEQRQYTILFKQPICLYDGYTWNDIEKIESEKKISDECIYQKYGCEDVYQLKKNVLTYHTNRLSELIRRYNQLTVLLFNIKGRWQAESLIKASILLSYQKVPLYCLGYMALDDFKIHYKCNKEENHLVFEIIYTDDSLHIHQETVLLQVERVKDQMRGTCLSPFREEAICLKIQLEMRHMQKDVIESIIQCLHKIIKQLQQIMGKKMQYLIGTYIDLTTIDAYNANRLIEILTPLGYDSIGQIKKEHFKPNQLLVHLKK